MNPLKRRLSKFACSLCPVGLVCVPALSPGVMAVEAGPDFKHEDARTGGPSAARALKLPDLPVAPDAGRHLSVTSMRPVRG